MNSKTLMGFCSPGFLSFRSLATLGVFLFATACQAGTVTATLQNYTGNPMITINYGDGTAPSHSVNTGAFNYANGSSMGSPALASAFSTFCIQLGSSNQIFQGMTYTYQTSSFATSTPSTGINTNAITAIERLWNGGYSTIGSTDGAAFQLAIWRLEYDWATYGSNGTNPSPTNLKNFNGALAVGNFRTTGVSSSVLNDVNTLLDGVYGGTGSYSTADTNLVALTGGYYTVNGTKYYESQNQLTATPEPSSICLGAIGVAVLITARFRRRKVTV